MEGLIPFLLHAIKHHDHPNHPLTSRSFSEGSARSYHQLLSPGGASFDGSSHRRTRSEFQPPLVDFLEQRSRFQLSNSRSLKMDSIPSPSISKQVAVSSHPQQPPPKESNFSHPHHLHAR